MLAKNFSQKSIPNPRENAAKKVRPSPVENKILNDAFAVWSDPNSSEDERKKAKKIIDATLKVKFYFLFKSKFFLERTWRKQRGRSNRASKWIAHRSQLIRQQKTWWIKKIVD